MLGVVPGDQYYRELVSSVLLGITKTEEVSNTHTKKYVSKSLFHATAVASKLAGRSNKRVVIAFMDSLYSGVVMIVNPPSVVSDPTNAVVLCRVELGMVKDCSVAETSKLWALTSGLPARIYLVPLYYGGGGAAS
ncbi:MAG: hypothetical protein F7C35_01595 [Desulfurococcales archaeon]|nr:hypothetical protein [Desulfurococcales archaeon]